MARSGRRAGDGDIIEAIEQVRRVLGDMPLEAFEAEWEKQWLVERV